MPITKRFGDKVKANEERLFIGREKERKLFAQFLKETRSPSILNISGLGGIGKSSLLDQFQRMTHNEGALFFLIDSRDFPHTPKDFTYFLADLLHIFIAPNAPYMKILQTCISHLDKLSQGQA